MQSQRAVKFPPRFEVLRQVGRGGMGMVFEALDWERYRRVALNAPAGIVHPNLVTLYALMLTDRPIVDLWVDSWRRLSYPGSLRRWKPMLFVVSAVLLLANPLDCFSQLVNEQPSSCCASRHCNPAGQSRACCKVQLFQSGQYFETAKKSPLPARDVTVAAVTLLANFNPLENFWRAVTDQDVHPPPGETHNVNLPLLI